jgi:hypothetical protein
MNKVLKEVKELRREIENIKAFCSHIAEAHDHIPHLQRAWNHAITGNFIYSASVEYQDITKTKIMLMEYILKLEDRVNDLEQDKDSPNNPK